MTDAALLTVENSERGLWGMRVVDQRVLSVHPEPVSG